ncbi:MAG: hypothetical protein LBU65_03820, partial [Planctomycetaceae bacterium]|nr:hypothetical protein [Planctomycetaceae bacterium]
MISSDETNETKSLDAPRSGVFRSTARNVVLGVVLLVVGLVPFFWLGFAPEFDFLSDTFPLVDVTYSVVGENDSLYVVDYGQRRLVKVDGNGEFVFHIDGRSRAANGFFMIGDVAPRRDGGFYIVNEVHDERGIFSICNQIQRYDSRGKYVKTCYTISYGDDQTRVTLMHRGQIKRLRFDDKTNSLTWFELTRHGVEFYEFIDDDNNASRDSASEKNLRWSIEFEDADRDIADIALFNNKSIVYTHKNGKIFRAWYEDGTNNNVIYDVDTHKNVREIGKTFRMSKNSGTVHELRFDNESEPLRENESLPAIPWELGCDSNGNVYFIDLQHSEVRCLTFQKDAAVKTVFSLKKSAPDDTLFLYRLNVNGDGKLSTVGSQVYVIDGQSGDVLLVRDNAHVNFTQRFSTYLQIVGALIAFAGFLLLVCVAYNIVFGEQLPLVLLICVGLVCAVIITAFFSFTVILDNFSSRNKEQVYLQLKQLVLQISETIDAEKLKQITKPSDYFGDDYTAVRQKLDRQFDQWNTNNADDSPPTMNGFVFAIYRVVDNRLYGQIFQDTTIGTHYPYNWLDYPTLGYSNAYAGELFATSSQSIVGDWIYALGPIRDKDGNVVAIFEVGCDLYSFQEQNRHLVLTIISKTAMYLVISVLILIELVFLFSAIYQRGVERMLSSFVVLDGTELTAPLRRYRQYILGEYSPTFLVRPLVFLFFAADSIALAFLPIMMKTFYMPQITEHTGLSEHFVIALPYSLIAFCFGIASLFAGQLTNPRTLRKHLYIGYLFSLCGFVTAALANYLNACYGNAVVGEGDTMAYKYGLVLLFLFSQALVGFGSGVSMIATRCILSFERRCGANEAGFTNFYAGWIAGVNVGLIIGTIITEIAVTTNPDGSVNTTYQYVVPYIAAIGLLILSLLLEQLQLKSFIRQCRPENYVVSIKPPKLTWYFMKDPRVWGLILFNTIPAYIIVAFLFYFFPVFADAQGYSSTTVGWYLLIAGI